MRDPFGNMQGFLGQFQQFVGNPMQYMMQKRLNLPQDAMNDPNKAIQHLLNNGQMSQAQYNQLRQMANKIQSNPQFAKMFPQK